VTGLDYDPYSWQVQDDPYPLYARLRAEAPVYRNERRDFWALSRHADILAALRDPARFSSANGVSLDPSSWGPRARHAVSFLAMDPPEHGRIRGLVAAAFSPRRIAALEPRIRQLARARLAVVAGLDEWDFAGCFALPLPMDVICELTGVPAADRDQVRAAADQLTRRGEGQDDRGRAAAEAARRLHAYYTALVASLRCHPGPDLISALIRAQDGGARLDDSQIVAVVQLLIAAGNESTGKLLGNAWYQGWVHRDAGRAGLAGQAAGWAGETLRYDPSGHVMARTVTAATELHGTVIPAGGRVVLLPASGNRDETVFDDPSIFDLRRDTSAAIAFGHGPHYCLGAALARLETRVALEEAGALLSGYEIDMDRAQRTRWPHVRGFAALPTAVTRRPVPPPWAV